MRLVLGDLHLLNEANDRYNNVLQNIHNGLSKLNVINKIDAVDFVGDILDCEYVTFKRITYFSFIMDLIGSLFSERIRTVIGNHDKYFKNDENNQNIIKYIKFDGDIIDTPTIVNRILYIPHYYDSNNFPIGLLNEDDFDIIIGHLGMEFTSTIEELTVEQIRKNFKKKPILSGHIHNMNLDYDSNIFFLGSLKSESWKEQSYAYSVGLLEDNEPKFAIFPYYKSHLMIDVVSEDQLREDLLKIFKSIHHCNSYYSLYDSEGKIECEEPADKYITSIINLKLKLFDKDIKKKTIDIIIDYCQHEVDDPAFMKVVIKPIFHIAHSDQPIDDKTTKTHDILKIDKQKITEQNRLFFDTVDLIKSGKMLGEFSKNKKFTKALESITDGEIERFSEFLIATNKTVEFSELIQSIK